MTVKDVVVSLARGTGPDVRQGVSQLLHVVQVAEQDLVIDRSPEVSRPEEVDRVEVRDVDSSSVGHGRVRSVLLDVHAEEADVDAVDLLEGEEGSGAVRKRLAHFAGVNESVKRKNGYLVSLLIWLTKCS